MSTISTAFTPRAELILYDPTSSSLASLNVSEAIDELDGLGAQFKTQTIAADLTISAGRYAVWAEPYVVAGVELYVEAGAEFVDIS